MLSQPHKSRRPSMTQRESPRAQLQKELPTIYKYKKLHHTHAAMHDNGTARQADDRMNTLEFSQAVRGNSDLPARAWGAASTLPQRLTVRAMDAPSRPQPVPTSARSSANIRGRENSQVDLIDLAKIGSTRWE